VVLRTDVYGQYSDGTFGVYASFAFFHQVGTSTTAEGGLEVGGIVAGGEGPVAGVFRLGLALPTASSRPEGIAATTTGSPARLGDAIGSLPERLTLRLSGSLLADIELFFARLDVGFDFSFPSDERSFREDLVGMRVSPGVGLDFGIVEWTIESVNAGFLEGVPGSPFRHTLGTAVHLDVEPFRAAVGYSLPLGEGSDGKVHVLTFNVQGVF
jgi:hypothetical protein